MNKLLHNFNYICIRFSQSHTHFRSQCLYISLPHSKQTLTFAQTQHRVKYKCFNDQPEGTCTDAYEDSGDRLLHALVRPDPFPTEDCGRITCQTVCGDIHGRCKNTCWQNHVNYTVYCKECETQGANDCKRHIYVGESSRGCHTRFLQEKKQCNPSIQGFMWNHVVEHHGGDTRTEFVVRRECIDSDPLRRVVREAVRIEKYMKDPSVVLMNGKEEHFGPQMVRPSFGMDWMD